MIKKCDVGAMAEIIQIEQSKSLGAQIALWTAPVNAFDWATREMNIKFSASIGLESSAADKGSL